MTLTYAQQTLQSPNPLAKFAHRNRLGRSVRLARSLIPEGGLFLDYGCGTGAFLQAMQEQAGLVGMGYEPYLREGVPGVRIERTLERVPPSAVSLVTLFETIEHLDEREFDDFLALCSHAMTSDGAILVSAPIEIGPALFLKEVNRSFLRFTSPEHALGELLGAALLGRPARRAPDIKCSHKGFDFRRAVGAFRSRGFAVDVLGYGPLPIGTWYGNSQVYWVARRAP